VSGSEVLYLQSTTSTSRGAVTINSSINNESGDITTVYSTNGQITVNPINQTINQYTSVNSGVDQIVAGNGVTITSTGIDGTGIVTINSDTTTLGNIVSINLDGNAANVLHGDGTWSADQTTYSNSNVVGLMAAFGSNTITTTGNVSVGNIIGNGQALTNIAGANVSGTVANATFATTAGSANSATAVAGANVSGTVANATFATTAGSANSAAVAASANSVTLANVSGAGNIASINLDGNVSNLLTGNGTYVAIPVVPTVGNIATLNLDGNSQTWLAGNGVFANIAVPSVGNIATLNLDGSNSNVLYGNGIFAPAAGGNTANANYANFAGTAYSVDGANVTGTVANATFATTAGSANSANTATTAGTVTTNAQSNITSVGTLTGLTVDGANITLANGVFVGNGAGLTNIAGANVSGFVPNANVANTAFAVAAGNVTGLVLNQSTIYVGKNGNDTTGNGTVINPYLTISKAVDSVSSGGVIIVYPGSYIEDVTINNKFSITISSETPGGKQPFTPALYGNLTISGNSSSFCFKGIGVEQTISHTSSGTVYLSEFNLGSGNVVGALSKTGSGSLAIQNCSMALVSGGNITPVTISGAGNVTFSNVALGLLSVGNTSATVSMLSDSTSLQANISAGSLNIFDSVLYTLANSGSNAIVGTGGVVNVRNSIAINPNQTTARLNIGPSTVLAYDDFYFDRPNSNVGINPNITIDFQSIRLANTLTANGNLSVIGNANVANIGATDGVFTGNISGNTNGFAIGYLNIPQVAAANATLALSDAGKHYYSTTAGNFTLTIPNNATTSFATGTAISIVVQAAGNILANADTGVTLYMAGNSTAANRVVGGYGMATLIKVATDTWFINGTGVS
jgi:hypothetical protein